MQPSLQNELLALSLKMDTSLQAIEQLSQLLTLLIAELQSTGRAPIRPEMEGSAPTQSPLLQALLDQLSIIRQELQRSHYRTNLLNVPKNRTCLGALSNCL